MITDTDFIVVNNMFERLYNIDDYKHFIDLYYEFNTFCTILNVFDVIEFDYYDNLIYLLFLGNSTEKEAMFQQLNTVRDPFISFRYDLINLNLKDNIFRINKKYFFNNFFDIKTQILNPYQNYLTSIRSYVNQIKRLNF